MNYWSCVKLYKIIFLIFKLYRGDGVINYRNYFERKNSHIIPFSKFYERADFIQKIGYQYNIMKLLGYDEENTSLLQRTLW